MMLLERKTDFLLSNELIYNIAHKTEQRSIIRVLHKLCFFFKSLATCNSLQKCPTPFHEACVAIALLFRIGTTGLVEPVSEKLFIFLEQ